jgi:hypothetical protein
MSFYLMAPSIGGGDTDKALSLANDIAKLDEVKGIAAKALYYSAVDDIVMLTLPLIKVLRSFLLN